jgi:hypothetical protein
MNDPVQRCCVCNVTGQIVHCFTPMRQFIWVFILFCYFEIVRHCKIYLVGGNVDEAEIEPSFIRYI